MSQYEKWQKKYYEKNRDYYAAKAKQRKREIMEAISLYKESTPCKDCGQKLKHYQMDFDHLNSKFLNISRMVKDGYSLQRILSEIEKCELVCANCHRERTYRRAQVK